MIGSTKSNQKCNNGKWAHDMEEWYKKQIFYSEVRLKKIHKWSDTDAIKNTQQIAFFKDIFVVVERS